MIAGLVRLFSSRVWLWHFGKPTCHWQSEKCCYGFTNWVQCSTQSAMWQSRFLWVREICSVSNQKLHTPICELREPNGIQIKEGRYWQSDESDHTKSEAAFCGLFEEEHVHLSQASDMWIKGEPARLWQKWKVWFLPHTLKNWVQWSPRQTIFCLPIVIMVRVYQKVFPTELCDVCAGHQEKTT